jgi:hypothetical protein
VSTVELRVVREFELVKVRIDEAVLNAANEQVRQGICCGCGQALARDEKGEPVHYRGLHPSTCYQATMRAVRKNRALERHLMKTGQLLPKQAPGRKPSNEYTQKLADMTRAS